MSVDVIRRNNVKVQGSGSRTMVFAHGFGCDQNMFRFIAPAFEPDFRLVFFDYVGCGKSDLTAYDPKRYGSLQGYAQDLLDVLRALEIEDAVVVAHSVSSMIALLVARQEPKRFSHLIMLGPSPRYINDRDYVGGFERADIDGLLDTMDKNYIGWANYLAPVVMGNPEHPELTTELVGSFCSTDPKIARKFAEVTFLSDNRADLTQVATPTLVVQVSDDVIAPVSVGQYVEREMPAAVMRIMEATGHCPHMSHPEDTVQVIQEYLASVGSRVG
jgi:sigma-B regulation protein RsbQ